MIDEDTIERIGRAVASAHYAGGQSRWGRVNIDLSVEECVEIATLLRATRNCVIYSGGVKGSQPKDVADPLEKLVLAFEGRG